MYVADHFALPADQVHDLLTNLGAADLVTAHDHGVVATLLPFVFDPDAGEHGALLTHVARNNRQCSDPVIGEAMVIVRGGDHYVSPRWMPSFAETRQVVPTWNYLTAHVYGELVAHDEPGWTEDVVRRLTAVHEAPGAAGGVGGYRVDDVPAEHLARQLRAIVGLELRITRIEAKAKMSQNKSPVDVAGIVSGLRAEGGGAFAEQTAAWMDEYSTAAARRRAELLAEVARRRGHG
ncbi:MAG: FMN-binding negative transcriptional regulator [Kineosporiaceae bacterium]